MKSNSIIDQNSTPGDDELNDETVDAETAKTMQVVNGVSHAKLVENRVTLQAPESVFKSAGLQTFKTSCTDVMNFVTSTSELLSTYQSCCNLQHMVPEHQGDRVDAEVP